HPEMGHMRVPRHPRDVERDFAGVCPHHGACLEGLASGPAIEARCGRAPADLAADDEGWEIEAFYIALALCNLVFVYRPQRIILGGGVTASERLRERVRTIAVSLIDPSYIEIGDGSQFVTPPGLGELAGVTGAIEL